jgi:hypothetical protein
MSRANRVLELFGHSTAGAARAWDEIVAAQQCPFTNGRCFKVRKSNPNISIGTCSVRYGAESKDLIICPNRLLQRRQVFSDCLHLLTLHEPGNDLHIVPEMSIPGGNVDFFLASARGGKVRDFVAIEFQTLDTTGTVWPERQRLLDSFGIKTAKKDLTSERSFGMNWKMTAKTILVQLFHKVETLEHIGKHFVLVVQDELLKYLRERFRFDHLAQARIGDSFHLHAYKFETRGETFGLSLATRVSTDAAGVATCLGQQVNPRVELEAIIHELESKISDQTLMTVDGDLASRMRAMPSE